MPWSRFIRPWPFRSSTNWYPQVSLAAPSFAELLITVPPRERSGPRSSNRFSFQHSYGLGVVLTRHEKTDDYCVLFDIHEDVFVLNDSVNPTSADVFQIKTDAATWTSHNLTKREKNKDTGEEKPSVLGNLYGNYVRFPGCIKSMSFVATSSYNVALKEPPPCGDRETFCITEIEETERKVIHAKIAAEHNVSDPPDGHAVTHLLRTSLSVQDHERHTEGIVSDFLSRQGDGTIPPAPFQRTLRTELRRRNDKEGAPASFAELVQSKGLTRADLQSMIDSVPTLRRMDDLAATIRAQLVQEGYSITMQEKLNAEVRNYLAHRLDATNAVLADAWRKVAEEIARLDPKAFASATPVTDIIGKVGDLRNTEFDLIRVRYSSVFLNAIITVAIYEQPELPTSPPQPAEKNT